MPAITMAVPEFVLFGNRSHTSYTDRMTTTTIADVESFTNTSTPGADFSGSTDPAVTIVNGDNTVNGYVTRFSNTKPGTDGDMLITVSSPTGRFYANALMLQATRESVDNMPPVANDDEGIASKDTPVDIKVIVNDTDPDGMINPNTVVIVRNPANGFVEHKGEGIVAYKPKDGFVGWDSFTYTVLDQDGVVLNEATVASSPSTRQAAPRQRFWQERAPAGRELTGVPCFGDTSGDACPRPRSLPPRGGPRIRGHRHACPRVRARVAGA